MEEEKSVSMAVHLDKINLRVNKIPRKQQLEPLLVGTLADPLPSDGGLSEDNCHHALSAST